MLLQVLHDDGTREMRIGIIPSTSLEKAILQDMAVKRTLFVLKEDLEVFVLSVPEWSEESTEKQS